MNKKLMIILSLIGLSDLVIARGGGHGGGHGGGGRGGGGRAGGGHGGGRGGHSGSRGGHVSSRSGGRGGHSHSHGYSHGGHGYGRYGYGRGYGYGGWGWGLGGFGLGIMLSSPWWWYGPGYYGGNTYIEDYSGWTYNENNNSLSKDDQQIKLENKDLKKALKRAKEDLNDMKENDASDSDIKTQQDKIDKLQNQLK